MGIKEIVEAWLKDHGYEGLYSDECGCIIDDLMPCGETDIDCQPGVIIKCKKECCSVKSIKNEEQIPGAVSVHGDPEYYLCLSDSINADCPYGYFVRMDKTTPEVKNIDDRKSELYAEMVSELKYMSLYLDHNDLAAFQPRSGFHLIINGLLKKAQELEEDINDLI